MFNIIEEEINKSQHLTITRMCQLGNVDKKSFYRWKKKNTCFDNTKSIIEKENPIVEKIQEINKSYPFYGYRRITKMLNRNGFIVNHKKVLKIMKELNLTVKRRKRKVMTTNSNHSNNIYPNLIKDLVIKRINEVWVSDITYIHFNNRFVYLAVILDAYSRKCIGWALSSSLESDISLRALHMAILTRGTPDGLIHHSDRGVQYSDKEYIKMLNTNNISISMSRKGNPYDNSICERFMRTLKEEEVYLKTYRTGSVLYKEIKHFIEEYYNDFRIHSSIGYLSPVEYEELLTNNRNIINL